MSSLEYVCETLTVVRFESQAVEDLSEPENCVQWSARELL
jgi:hypothetical protein